MKLLDHLSKSQKSRRCAVCASIIGINSCMLFIELIDRNILKRRTVFTSVICFILVLTAFAIVWRLFNTHFKLFVLLNTQLQQDVTEAKETVKQNAKSFNNIAQDLTQYQRKQIPYLLDELEKYNATLIV